MANTDYTWKQSTLETRKMCRSKSCARAHYKYGKPKQQLVYLYCQPARSWAVNEILFCPRCKELEIPGWK